MKILGIIPARYASTRFPAKALANIGGKTMVQRVFEQALKASGLTKVVVATDHELIYNEVLSFGGEARMTSPDHQSGTDRCMEVLNNETSPYDYVVNIQGDEPFIEPDQINTLISCLDGNAQLATLIKKIEDPSQLFNNNVVKVIFDKNKEAIYFSRESIPHLRGVEKENWLKEQTYFKHIGIYAYRADILSKITLLPLSSLEKSESLEQLRWLENGFKIRVEETFYDSHGIDTPEDLWGLNERMSDG